MATEILRDAVRRLSVARGEQLGQEIPAEMIVDAARELRRPAAEEGVVDGLSRRVYQTVVAAQAACMSEVARLRSINLDDAEEALTAYTEAVCTSDVDEVEVFSAWLQRRV